MIMQPKTHVVIKPVGEVRGSGGVVGDFCWFKVCVGRVVAREDSIRGWGI